MEGCWVEATAQSKKARFEEVWSGDAHSAPEASKRHLGDAVSKLPSGHTLPVNKQKQPSNRPTVAPWKGGLFPENYLDCIGNLWNVSDLAPIQPYNGGAFINDMQSKLNTAGLLHQALVRDGVNSFPASAYARIFWFFFRAIIIDVNVT